MSITVAVVAMGEMGAGVAARLTSRGARVLTSLEGRSSASAQRAKATDVVAVPSDEALVAGADMVLSIVPPARAAALAERLLPAIRAVNPKLLYVDCNAVAPQTVKAIAAPFLEAGLAFCDAGIVGGPPATSGFTPTFYASGPGAEAAAALNEFGLDVRPMSDRIGDASALKMAYAGTTKGASAVMICMMLGAARAGVADAFIAEMAASQSGRLEAAARSLPIVFRKAYRWDGEMEEIAKFLDPETGGAAIFNGAAELYRRIAEDYAEGEASERMTLLKGFQDPS